MKKKLVCISLLLVIVMVLGGLSIQSYLTNKEEQRTHIRQGQHAIEEQLAQKIRSEYADVKKIEFKGWGHSIETGFWGVSVVINDKNEIAYSFAGLSSINDMRGSTYHPDSFTLKKRSGTSSIDQPLEIIYSDR